MIRPANDAAYPIHDLLKRRYSPRAFADRAVEPEKLRSMMEAARWAPSCFNEQPWGYIVATKETPAEYERMLGCLFEKNQGWAQSAPVLMISVVRVGFTQSGKSNRFAMHDVGSASACMTIQALSMDIYVHQMGGFDVEKAREAYAIPASAEPMAAIAAGYRADIKSLSEETQQRELTPSTRRPIGDFVYAGKWGYVAEWAKK